MADSDKGQVAFRWAPLVAVLAVVLLGMCLFLPAISKVHEASYKMQCAKNVRDIAIACHNYHNDYQKLPSGYFGPIPHQTPLEASLGNASWVGLLPQVLPYLECDDIYKKLKLEADLTIAGRPWWTENANLTQATWHLKRFRCPTEIEKKDAADDSASQGLIVAIHAFNSRTKEYHLRAASIRPPLANQLGRTNYVGVMGAMSRGDHPFWDAYAGIFGNRTDLTLGQVAVQDGTSNTLMLGESLGGSLAGGRDFALSWFGAGGLPTAYGLGLGSRLTPANGGAAWYRFSSRHSSVVLFAFADGSTRGIRFGTTARTPVAFDKPMDDWSLLQQLAGRKDGLNADTSAVVD